MWRFAPTTAKRDQNAPRQLCRTIPAYFALLWKSCVCVGTLPRCETKGTDSPNIEVDRAQNLSRSHLQT